MSRLSKPDTTDSPDTPSASTPEETPARTSAASGAPEPTTATDATSAYEPYPGAHYFHGGRHSQIVHAMARRLVQEGHWTTTQPAGPDWTNGHKRAFAAFQHTLRPKEGGDVSGIPDEVAWDRLQVPRVSPVPIREN
ncbi:peptidoglycan-binding protein [Streptomyces sp. rh34]|uniref:peptidoglycan-binding protein n=1 Tax=Streptomyces sp. rh34 TaxID=2034272 RepID=UPI000BEFE36E|nr:peptidoglycan-binding protein [Streptomyces sp. rh34]